MDRSSVITLIGSVQEQDENGVWRGKLSERDVYCNVTSVAQAEFFEGARSGLNPAFRMTIFGPDYEDETMLRYKGKTYSIYRAYMSKNDTIELYVERKGGTNGKKADG